MRFRTNKNIFVDYGEYFEPHWTDSNKVEVPPNPKWDYSRELGIEDVDIWEVIWEAGGGNGVYAAWCPYAEFYMVLIRGNAEYYYGPLAEKKVQKRMKELNIQVFTRPKWVDPEDMWLYTKPEPTQALIL
jgi:hypothetical protein